MKQSNNRTIQIALVGAGILCIVFTLSNVSIGCLLNSNTCQGYLPYEFFWATLPITLLGASLVNYGLMRQLPYKLNIRKFLLRVIVTSILVCIIFFVLYFDKYSAFTF